MAKGSDNPFPSILMVEEASPANPAAGRQRLFIASADGLLKLRDSGGVEHPFGELSDTAPLVAGTAAAGTATKAARDDHVHPSEGSTVAANVQTASYTLVLADAGKAVEMDVAAANNLTVPANATVAFPVGTLVEVCQVGAGATTIVADTGVTVRTPETLVMSGQWSSVSLRKRAADEWVLAGDVNAA
jgi:hypothetical protein